MPNPHTKRRPSKYTKNRHNPSACMSNSPTRSRPVPRLTYRTSGATMGDSHSDLPPASREVGDGKPLYSTIPLPDATQAQQGPAEIPSGHSQFGFSNHQMGWSGNPNPFNPLDTPYGQATGYLTGYQPSSGIGLSTGITGTMSSNPQYHPQVPYAQGCSSIPPPYNNPMALGPPVYHISSPEQAVPFHADRMTAPSLDRHTSRSSYVSGRLDTRAPRSVGSRPVAASQTPAQPTMPDNQSNPRSAVRNHRSVMSRASRFGLNNNQTLKVMVSWKNTDPIPMDARLNTHFTETFITKGEATRLQMKVFPWPKKRRQQYLTPIGWVKPYGYVMLTIDAVFHDINNVEHPVLVLDYDQGIMFLSIGDKFLVRARAASSSRASARQSSEGNNRAAGVVVPSSAAPMLTAQSSSAAPSSAPVNATTASLSSPVATRPRIQTALPPQPVGSGRTDQSLHLRLPPGPLASHSLTPITPVSSAAFSSSIPVYSPATSQPERSVAGEEGGLKKKSFMEELGDAALSETFGGFGMDDTIDPRVLHPGTHSGPSFGGDVGKSSSSSAAAAATPGHYLGVVGGTQGVDIRATREPVPSTETREKRKEGEM
ncbi:hypothetical protein F4778DRAFT_721453 [Xylariomycetidae sp. FL2044]|nr:hypothetical protein F4778DRAFT_721453 [Xylariomycetidae sp. FL2044]